MKIAVSAIGAGLSSEVDSRFGRCSTFIIYDTETKETQSIPNTSISSAHGAGIAAANLVAKYNVEAVLTGHVGPNAYMALSGIGIQVYSGVSGTVKESITKFENGQLPKVERPTVTGHYGKRGGRGRRIR